jgi:TolB-like protein/class 3 adenylate cyclase/Tfp pilus assembly protein PilF
LAIELPQRLAAILAADIASYTRLMEADEPGVVEAWRRARAYVIDPAIARYRGRIVKLTGDGFLAEFSTAENAVRAGLEMQQAFAALFADQPAGGRVEFRMGVNLCDISVDADDIYGAGVNVAARLEALAQPGSLCISEAVYQAVNHKVEACYDALGPQSLKNVAKPINAWHVRGVQRAVATPARMSAGFRMRAAFVGAGAVAVAVLAAALWTWNSADLPAGVPKSIAVLPLVNLSGNADQDYFVDGMTEALITSLSRLSGLKVTSRTSVMRYKINEKSLPAIAAELGVSRIIEGSAQLVGDRVRITAQLIDAATDQHLWAEEYDRDFADVLRLQSDIARRIASEVQIAVTPAEAERLAAVPAVNPETYRAYLRGMHYLNKGTRADSERGLVYLHEAVDRDPGDARAHAGLALGYATFGHGAEPQGDVWPLARAAALRAIALDPNLAEAHAALADVKLYMEWDWEGAEAAFERANELAPSLAMNRYHHAWYLALFSRWEEAIAEHKLAQQLDPLTPLHTLWLGGLYLYSDSSRYGEAIEEAQRALALAPDNTSALMVLGMAYSAAGLHDQAIATQLKMVALEPALEWQLGLSYARAGRMDDVRAIIARLDEQPPTSWTAFGRAVLHAQVGDLDEAFAWLDYEPAHAWVPWTRVDPWLRPKIEHDPRFTAWLERLRLPP